MSNKYGEKSWSDDPNYGRKEKGSSNPDLWMRLSDGSNVVRVLTNPFQYLTHKSIKKVGDPGYGRKVPCSQESGKCPLCDAGLKAGLRWYIGVLDRASNSYKVLDIPYQIHSQICSYNAKTDVWGDPSKYDFDILKQPKNAPNIYTVQPIPHKPLTPAEQKIRDENVDLEYLEQKCQPPTTELVQKILDNILGEDGVLFIPPVKEKEASSKFVPRGGNTQGKSKTVPTVSMMDSDDVEEIFPTYGGDTSDA